MSPAEVAATLRQDVAEQVREMERLEALKPRVTDKHSDGLRVRYVRAETRRKALEKALAMLEEDAPMG